MLLLILSIHIVGVLLALSCGFLAFRYPNGTKVHRLLGRGYILGWLLLTTGGTLLGARHPGISVFEILTWIGAVMTLRALFITCCARRTKGWRERHYEAMLLSYVFVIQGSLNQILSRVLPNDMMLPLLVLLVVAPFFGIPIAMKRLRQRFP